MKNMISIDKNLLSGIISTLISSSLIFLIPQQIVVKRASTISAQTFPSLILYIMLFCSIGLLIKGVFFKGNDHLEINLETMSSFSRPLLLALIFSLYSFGVITIGFMPASILVSVAIMAFYRNFKLKPVAISVVVAIAISLFFEQVLGVILP